jgi:leucyl-tRNA synthetase
MPIQVMGKLVTKIETQKNYSEEKLLKAIYQLDKIKSKIENKKILKIINVQNKIINIITD